MQPFTFTAGTLPLLVSMPHPGTFVPPDVEAALTPAARALPDTDWHIPQLYDFLGELGASVLCATHSRYVIDLNRPPNGESLYAGASNTELCPTTTFDEDAVYQPGRAPRPAEIASRRDKIWQPYHDKLGAELDSLKARHGIALLWDAHSIRSHVPRFFEGRLPDLNFGTGDGVSAHPSLLDILVAVAREAAAVGFSHAVNGRFKGGYITRHHGRPGEGIHAVQLELSQVTYMDEDPPYGFREDLAKDIRPVLSGLLQTMLAWAEMAVED